MELIPPFSLLSTSRRAALSLLILCLGYAPAAANPANPFEKQAGAASGFLKAESDTLDFGRIEERATAVSTIMLTNSGGRPVRVENIGLHWGDESAWIEHDGCKAPLPPAASCALTVGWKPAQAGARTGSLVVSHDGVNRTARIRITGIALAAEKKAEISTLIQDFGRRIGTESPMPQIQQVRLDARLIGLSRSAAILAVNGLTYIIGDGDRIAIADIVYTARLSPPNLVLSSDDKSLTIPFGNRFIQPVAPGPVATEPLASSSTIPPEPSVLPGSGLPRTGLPDAALPVPDGTRAENRR